MPGPALLDPYAAASYLAVTRDTLARWRIEGGGPPFIKIGCRIRYNAADLEAWLDARRRRSTSDAAPQPLNVA